MMDQIASLMARGLISPDAAQGMVQKVADLKNRMPFESGGGAPTNSVYTPRGYGEPTATPAETNRGSTQELRDFKRISEAYADGAYSKGKGKNPHAGIPGREDLAEAWDRGRAGWEAARAKMSGSSPSNSIDHLENLKSAGTDEGKFRDAFDKLSNDKSVKTDDLKQIVKDYDAGVVRGKTRADHLNQIQKAFTRNARFENKLE